MFKKKEKKKDKEPPPIIKAYSLFVIGYFSEAPANKIIVIFIVLILTLKRKYIYHILT